MREEERDLAERVRRASFREAECENARRRLVEGASPEPRRMRPMA